MGHPIERTALFLVYHGRIQASLDRAARAWNTHQMRTEHQKTPLVMWHLSRTEAIRLGYWHSDPGDDFETASDPLYGVQGEGPLPHDPTPDFQPDAEDEIAQGIRINDDARLEKARELLPGIDFDRVDGNHGMNVYQEVVRGLLALQEEWDSE